MYLNMSNQRSSQNNDTVRTTPTNHDLLNPTERGQNCNYFTTKDLGNPQTQIYTL